MKPRTIGLMALAACGLLGLSAFVSHGQEQKSDAVFRPAIPKTWDDKAMATLEVPLANPIGSPKHVSADYYYKIPVRPIYKSYAVYAFGHEPTGYMDWLKRQEPEIVWDDKGHAPPLETEADWIKAGRLVFEAPIHYNLNPGITPLEDITDPAWYQATGTPSDGAGRLPFYSFVVRKKGQVDLGTESCAMCHTRIMRDGTTVKGAQGSFPFDTVVMFSFGKGRFESQDIHGFERGTFAVPWLRPDPQAILDQLSVNKIVATHEAIPPGVMARHRSSPYTGFDWRERQTLPRCHRFATAALNCGPDALCRFEPRGRRLGQL